MEFEYRPHGVCSTNIAFEIEDGKLHNVKFTRGCNGNLKAIGLLVEGKPAEEVAEILKGNDCNGRGTSCADQFSQAITAALEKMQAQA
jgi:uncharacterized protein (TIGR03905 family)